MADPPPPDAQPERAPAAEKPPAAPLTPEPEDAAEIGEQAEESEVDEEYVSDPDDALPEMRRREASDDEGSEEGRRPPRARIEPDNDDDGQGAPEDYEDEEEEEYYDDLLEEEVGEGLEEEYDGRAVPPKEVTAAQGEEGEKAGEEGAEAEADGEEKKEQEPFAVPTSGAFYMHDDRFQEDGRGRRRRMLGGRKLWDAKDDQAWVHDRFEEMNVHEERYEDKRMSRGRFRGRGGGRTRGTAHGSSRGGRYRSYHEDGDNQNRSDNQNRRDNHNRSDNHSHSDNHNRPQKVVRGRGPRRYDTIAKNNREVVGFQCKLPTRSREPASHSTVVREFGQISNAHSEAAPATKNVVNSSLNSASPPFYPSGASNHAGAQRRDVQAGGSNKVFPSVNMKLQSGPAVRGRTATDYGGRDRFHAEGPVRPSPARTAGASSNSSGFAASAGQSPSVRAQGGNASMGVPSQNQPTSSFHQTSRISTQQQNHNSVMHQKSGQVPTQLAMRMPTQQLNHRIGNSSPTAQHLPARSTESSENGSYSSSNQSKTLSSEVEKTNKETGRGSFMYGGAQVIGAAGAVGLAQGEQSFPGTPALLPVMQFGGQHPGGHGGPTVGMALPGYVAQQQLGMGNNEMAWLPLLAGAAGAFGGSYPPYVALDPSFYSRSSGQTSSSIPSREANVSKGAKSPPPNDVVTEELDQRQNKPRRYSEMNFSQ